ncbi:hypothetical protein [Candidatus Chromulinivorax destructor]|uniref:Uncharacterized protein n=1 Tax=Candidatus Chromulinivorax destructor TaxID=2066483 RepID=A0A345ZCI3_9BACT|nr:hypothetical protein [Candidatus Chromulinivorax destructor]AXK61000.1 hypothetical protein C0J27_04685 [Candidatus Chromulinivorax destructor]
MKNTNFNRLLMVLMMSASVASARVAQVQEVTVTETSSPVVSKKLYPLGLESHYQIEEIDNGPEYVITEVDKAHYREEAAPVDFTIEAPSAVRVGENPNAPLMGQIDVAMDKLKNMKRIEDAKDLSLVVFELEMANHEIQSLPILEGNPKEYDRAVIRAEKRLRAAEHAYRKATHGSRSKN